jgi:fucose permease
LPVRPISSSAVETGIEIGVGIWGFLFLTSGRGMGPEAAGLAVSAYWAMMFVGRILLGAVAERVGARVVLAWAVGGVAVGTALMAVPGSGVLAVVAMMVVGVAAAPVFPLLALTTRATRVVSWQVAASSVGGAVIPAGIGLAVDASRVTVLAPLLVALGVAMCGGYAVVACSTVDLWPAV